jgi:hypothetical protein
MASPDPVNLTAIVGAVTGVCALCLSVYNTVAQELQKRTRVSVVASYGLTTPPVTTVIALKCANVGNTDVNLTSCGLSLPGDQTAIFVRPRFLPKTVSARDSVCEVENLDELKDGLRRHGFTGKIEAFGWVDDAVGQRHRSKKPLSIDLDAA